MIAMQLYYDRDGVAIDRNRWAELYSPEYGRVARTKVTDAADPSKSLDVSTVWLGIDHRHGGDGPPIIFETMVFGEDSSIEEYCDRYSTEAQARQGHTAAVVEASQGMTDPIVIDAAVGCQQCGGPLGDSPSDDFCQEACRTRWHRLRADPLIDCDPQAWSCP